MAKHKINPETLKTLRTKAKLSQQGLADVSGVSKKTIARIETCTGKSSANTTTITRLAQAFNIRPEQLSKSAESSDFLEFNMGYRKVKLVLPGNMLLALQMVEKYYDIPQFTQLRMLPLFTALLMESSLAWRKQKVEEAEESFNKYKETYKHLPTTIPEHKIEESLMAEKGSIEQRDFFGKIDLLDSYYNQYHFDNDDEDDLYSICRNGDEAFCDRFQQFLKYLVEKLDSDLIRVQGESSYSRNIFEVTSLIGNQDLEWINYTINPLELDFITDGNELACKALQWGYATIKDIPQELMVKEKTAERIEWLTNKIPQKRREDYEKYWADFRNKLGPINL